MGEISFLKIQSHSQVNTEWDRIMAGKFKNIEGSPQNGVDFIPWDIIT